jgi:TP901 family phage tail tape measure protein
MDNLQILIQAILSLKDTNKSKQQIASELPKLESQLQSDKNARVKILAELDTKSKDLIKSQLDDIINQAKSPTIKVGIEVGSNVAENNISNEFKEIQSQANQTERSIVNTSKSLTNLQDKFKKPIEPVFNSEGLIDAEKTIEKFQNHFAELGEISIHGNYSDNNAIDSLDSVIVRIKNTSAEARNLNFELDETGEKFHLIGGSSDNSGVQKLSDKIKETHARYTRLLADFKNSNSAIESGLTKPIEEFEKILNGLTNGTSSINDVKNAFESLKTSASEINKYLSTTDSSFNKSTNAINHYKEMDNIINELSVSLKNLSIKPNNLDNDLSDVKSKLIELQELEKTNGTDSTWAKKYQEVNIALKEVQNNIKLAQQAESDSTKADKNSAYQVQLKYLNQIKENTNIIIQNKKKLVGAGEEESKVYEREITLAQKRIKYEENQLSKKQLLTDEAKKQINVYKEQIQLQNKINSAKIADSSIEQQTQEWEDLNSKIEKVISKLESYNNNTTFTKNSSNSQVQNLRQEIQNLLADCKELQIQLQGDMSVDGLEQVKNSAQSLEERFDSVTDSVKQLKTSLNNTTAEKKLSQDMEILRQRIILLRDTNKKAQKQFGSTFDGLLNDLDNCKDRDTYNQIVKNLKMLDNQITITGNKGNTFLGWDSVKKFGNWMGVTNVISTVWRDIKQMVTNVIELDTAMTNLKKVTDETDSTYSSFLKNTTQQAKELKIDLSDLVDQTAEWAKKGYSLSESSILSQASGIYSVVGEVDNATAVQDLTTVMKSYNMTVEESMDIVDKFNNVSNKYSVTAADIGEILSNSISSLSVAGNSLDEAISMGTTIAEITGDASEAGNTLKVLSMRLRGASTEIEQMGESTDGMAESTSKLQAQIKALTNIDGTGGFDIMADSENFKSTYEIMQGISEVWQDMSDVDQAKSCLYVQKCA